MRKLLIAILLLLTTVTLFAQQKVVSGKVADKAGVPLSGVSVKVKGSATGTVTDNSGNFSIPVTAGRDKSIIISSVGYADQEITIGSKTSFSISLESVTDNLDEVVVVGYQSVKRKDLTGSVSTVSGKEIAQKPISNFTQLLQGKVAGVQVIGQSGRPGQNGYVRVRGTGSINASNEPLIIIDGVPASTVAYNMLNPNDIENVTILKDAAASAIYGSRAGNGVMVISTKRGKTGAPEVKYSYQRGFINVQPLQNTRLMNSQEKLKFEYTAGYANGIVDSMVRNRITAGIFPAGSTLFSLTDAQRQEIWDLATSRGVGDWGKYYLNSNAATEQHEISLSGASEKFRYYFSLNKLDEQGAIYKSFRDRLGGRLNVEYSPSEKFKTGINIGVTSARDYQNREPFNTQNPWSAYFLNNPYEPLRMPNGSYNLTLQGFSPLEGQDNNTNYQNRITTFSTLFGEFKPIQQLVFKSQLAINYNTLMLESYLQPGSNLAAILGYNEKTDAGNQDFNYVITNTATYTNKFKNNHNYSVLLGQEFTRNNFYSYQLASRGYPNATVTTQENGATAQTATTSRTQWSLLSYFGNISYDYKKKYALNVSARRDGASRFGANNRYANFWAVGGSWNITKEPFMEQFKSINDLKLKASYGTSGNVPTQLYGSLGTYSLAGTYNNITAATPAQIGNQDLTWEKSKAFDAGIEIGMFNNRLTASVEYYNRLTTDLLYPRTISQTTGFASILSNVGSVRNAGLEVSLGGDIISKKDLNWNLTLNFTNNKNTVVSLISDNVPSNNTRLKIGEPLNTFFMVKWAGINPANGKNQYYKPDGSITETYAAGDAVLLSGKSPLAKYFGGLSTSLTYKTFDLSMQFNYVGGGYTYNNMYQGGLADAGNFNVINRNLYVDNFNYWTKPGDVASFPNMSDATQRVAVLSDRFLQKNDYISLRDIVVGYNLSAATLKKIGIKQVRFFVQGTNLWIGTKFKGIAEVGFPNREAGATTFSQPGEFNLYGYPPVKAVTVGVDIKF